jgi:hypothetical protein
VQRLARITFVPLDGPTPAGVQFDELPSWEGVSEVVRDAFTPYLDDGGSFVVHRDEQGVQPLAEGLQLVYAFGHAWQSGTDLEASTLPSAGQTRSFAGEHLLRYLVAEGAATATILVLDCCHAAAFDRLLHPENSPRLVVYACAESESALAFHKERATRLSLGFSKHLRKAAGGVDLLQAVFSIAKELNRDGVVEGQAVSYRMNGPALVLARGAHSGQQRREQTVARIRNMLVSAGALVAGLAVLCGWYYWSHAVIEVDLSELHGISSEVRLVGALQRPNENATEVFEDRPTPERRVRIWAPADNLILELRASYPDGKERQMRWHLVLAPGFGYAAKHVALSPPPAAAIQAHADMAFVPPTKWRHERDLELKENSQGYWIDIRPPTVQEYESAALALMRAGKLDAQNSFLLTWRQRSNAIDAVGGVGNLRQLAGDLGKIIGIIESANSSFVGAPGDIVVGTAPVPCATCPAPMTRLEAELYCTSRGMRLPTNLEWELAVRGVDGRVFPWGNRVDSTRANIPGLPQKGEESPKLKPVDAYPEERSPFGLLDTVGNAGDWVTNATGSYERVYMGATYQFNPEDATAFRMQPVTSESALVREITVRCVD